MISACGANSNTKNEYTFTLVESDGHWGGRIRNDLVNRDVVYITATDQNTKKQYFNRIDTSDGAITKLTMDNLFDDVYSLFEIFPLDGGGYYIFAWAPAEDKQILKRFTPEFEPKYEINLLDHVEPTYDETFNMEIYDYEICGITVDGDIVVWTPDETFTITQTGEKKQTWEYINTSGNSAYTSVLVSGNDIYRCENNVALNNIHISRLQVNGVIEPYADIDSVYVTVMLDNGVFYIADDSEQTLYMLNDKGEKEILLTYSDMKTNGNLHDIVALSGGRYIAYISRDYYLISKNNGDSQPVKIDERTKITLATYGNNSPLIREQVYNFNQDNTDFSIEIIDYSEFADGVTQLNLEIVAGTAPDLIYWGYGKAGIVANFNPEIYSKAGVLLDLYPYLDSDEKIGRNTILPNLLKAIEGANGALYEIPLYFILQVVAGSVDVVGTEPGWTFDEYFALLKQYPGATLPFGSADWQILLRTALSNNYNAFVDWENGELYFDTEEFSRLLQITKDSWSSGNAGILAAKSIKEGKQILSSNVIGDVSSIQHFKALFGKEVNCIGFPTTEGIGNSFVLNGSISINAASDNADECWEFIERMLTYDVQLNRTYGFPVNYEALAERLDNAAKYEEPSGVQYTDNEGDVWSMTYTDATLEEIAQVRGIIESCDRIYRDNGDIMTIIEEEVLPYFNGDKTVEEVCKIIQNRVQIYVSEQSK